ncbi:MAG TPA: hypothetical protein VM053_08945 [Gemmatimonadaceae bacterium]|nr:hypothetical protein [Gemmatimonadaceae bacterium]
MSRRLAVVRDVVYVRVMAESAGWVRSLRCFADRVRIGGLLAASVVLTGGCQPGDKPNSIAAPTHSVQAPARAVQRTVAPARGFAVRTSIGFRSRQYLNQHFAKHGGEFRGASKAEYLLAAQTLRDRPVGGDIEEIVRGDGTASRFDRASGAFIAFNRDGTIRTFFKPNDGERYFRRQAQRSH